MSPCSATDSGSGSAQALVDELGGERVASNRELAERVDLVVLCHKPYQLDTVAHELSGHVRPIASGPWWHVTGRCRRRIRTSQVFALIPNTPVEVRQGVIVYGAPTSVELRG